jgi:hypothetical protein
VSGWRKFEPNGLLDTANSPKLDCRKAAEGKPLHWRRNLPMIAMNLKVLGHVGFLEAFGLLFGYS